MVVIDRVDQHGNAERVGEQDELLPRAGAHLAGIGQEGDALGPFLLRWADLANEIVQVADECFADLLGAGIRRAGDALQYRLGDTVLVEVPHPSLPALVSRPGSPSPASHSARRTVEMKSASPSPRPIRAP